MYTIGIEGKTGVGKSTVSEYLQKKYGVININVDNLMKENNLWGDLDDLLFVLGNHTQKAKYKRKIEGERIESKKKLSLNAKAMIKLLILSKRVNRLVKKELSKYEISGAKYAIVDFAKSDAMDYWRKLDTRIFVKKEEEKRKKALRQREGNSFESWIKKYDSFLPYAILQYDNKGIEYTINNDGSLEDLKKQVDEIFLQIQSKNKSRKNFIER